jgi:hypothetical protein
MSDEDLGGARLPGEPVEHRRGIPGEVHEQLLARRMGLSHGRRDPMAPFDLKVAAFNRQGRMPDVKIASSGHSVS